MADNKSFVVLGRLTRPHGIKGEMRVEYYAEDPAWLEGELWLGTGRGEPRPVTIESWREQGDLIIVRVKGIADRTQAEFLRGCELLLEDGALSDEEDAPYIAHIIGCAALLEDGSVVGTVEDVIFPAENEIWVIRATPENGNAEILFPAMPDFVAGFDMRKRTVTITPPEGLLEVYLEQSDRRGDDA